MRGRLSLLLGLALLAPAAGARAEGSALVLPALGDGIEADRETVVQAVSRALAVTGFDAVPADGECAEPACAPELVDTRGAAMAVAVALWRRRGGAQVSVTLIDAAGGQSDGSADVGEAGLEPAAVTATTRALEGWEGRHGVVVRIDGSPRGAAVVVDRTPRGALPVELVLAPGAHEMSVSATGYRAERRTIEVPRAAEPWRVQVHLEEAPGADGGGHGPGDAGAGRPVLGPVLLGLAGLGLFAVDAVALARAGCEGTGPDGQCRRIAPVPFALFAAGGALAIGGAVLWHFLGGSGEPPADVTVTSRGASAAVRLRF